MVDYRRQYQKFFGYGEQDFAPCEKCGNPLDDVHHIQEKGMGGNKLLNFIMNLCGLCRRCHDDGHRTGNNPISKDEMKVIHLKFIIPFMENHPEKKENLTDSDIQAIEKYQQLI